jgi:hypothetical protein
MDDLRRIGFLNFEHCFTCPLTRWGVMVNAKIEDHELNATMCHHLCHWLTSHRDPGAP